MKKHNLVENKGLSLSQAQSLSNLCNQRAKEIDFIINNINNYKKVVLVNSKGYDLQKPFELPSNITDLILEKASLHACQAFLMENIKTKDAMLKNAQNDVCDISSLTEPVRPTYERANILDFVVDDWGWEQLTQSEINEYTEVVAFASHIGQFIHKGGVLDKLRNELPTLPAIEWMELETGKKTPVEITVHHKSEDLLKKHEELAVLHRKYEQRVNYYKAKVKNLTTQENARIANVNEVEQNRVNEINQKLAKEYEIKYQEYLANVASMKNKFEKERQDRIKSISSMRIEIDTRYQSIIDKFNDILVEEK